MSEAPPEELKAVEYLQSTRAIRERCHHVLEQGLLDELEHFHVDLDCLANAADRVAVVARENYPDLDIPFHCRWNHFEVGDPNRLASLELTDADPYVRGRALYDLVITSVLLDAGAGAEWSYEEGEHTYSRSEGLAVASFHMFRDGAFSSSEAEPLRADADKLTSITREDIARHFQVTINNPLVGLEGRAGLLRRLGDAVLAAPEIFGAERPRVGGLFDYLANQAEDDRLAAHTILTAVLKGLGPIWPGRIQLADVNLGDVWPHPRAGGEGPSAGLVPFHKLSQWLTYSLIQPLEDAGIRVVDVDALTGLAEYRNGGLFVDSHVLVAKHVGVAAEPHPPGSEIIVEWRALTVALLDRIADPVRKRLGVSVTDFPLAKVLEAGTWAAGRTLARELREDGSPPIRIDSDGTVF